MSEEIIKISALPQAIGIADNDLMVMVDNDSVPTTKKITFAVLKDNIGGSYESGNGIDITGSVISTKVGGVLSYSGSTLIVNIGAGLNNVSGNLVVGNGNGLGRSSSQLFVDLATNSGMEFSLAKLKNKVADPIKLTSNGIELGLGPGLQTVGGNLTMKLAADSGLDYEVADPTKLRVGAGSGLSRSGSLINVGAGNGLDVNTTQVFLKAHHGIQTSSSGTRVKDWIVFVSDIHNGVGVNLTLTTGTPVPGSLNVSFSPPTSEGQLFSANIGSQNLVSPYNSVYYYKVSGTTITFGSPGTSEYLKGYRFFITYLPQ
jgi:hypothetical protein